MHSVVVFMWLGGNGARMIEEKSSTKQCSGAGEWAWRVADECLAFWDSVAICISFAKVSRTLWKMGLSFILWYIVYGNSGGDIVPDAKYMSEWCQA
eukprot:9624051-Ditylum_brightwellii.AAC.2